ncbi:MAG: hypothetical protein IJU46_02680 [Clostridia bacterium]|nr:hypothetical protein [Clostridia bacterium]
MSTVFEFSISAIISGSFSGLLFFSTLVVWYLDAFWVILPVDSFNAYFGTTCFDRKWLPEFPEEIIVRDDYAGLCRYKMII